MPNLAWDPAANKHQGNAESIAAHKTVIAGKEKTYAEIEGLLAMYNRTSKELAKAMGKGLNCISGRLTELSVAGRIERTQERREGAAVWRLSGTQRRLF